MLQNSDTKPEPQPPSYRENTSLPYPPESAKQQDDSSFYIIIIIM